MRWYRTLPLWAMGLVFYVSFFVLLGAVLIFSVRTSFTHAIVYPLIYSAGATLGELYRVAGARRRAGGAEALERIQRAVRAGTVPDAVNDTDRWISVLLLLRDRLKLAMTLEPVLMGVAVLVLIVAIVFFGAEPWGLWIVIAVAASLIVWRLRTPPRRMRVMTEMLDELTRRADAAKM